MTYRPNILFLAHRVPYPPNRGDRIRSWNMLKFLAERADVHLACTTEEPVPAESLNVLHQHCERVHVQPLPRLGRWLRGLASLATGRSATEGLFASRKLHAVIAAWSRETRFDAVFVFCSSMFQYAKQLRISDFGLRNRKTIHNPQSAIHNPQSFRLVVDLVDVDSEKFHNYAESAPLGKRQLYRLEAQRVRKLETRIARQADAVLLVSDEEVRVFHQFCKRDNIHAVQNGVDLDHFHPARDRKSEVGSQSSEVSGHNRDHSPLTTHHSPNPQSAIRNPQSYTLVFTGVLNYRPNVDGLRWFCHNVWTKLRERIPHAELHIVGRHAGEPVRRLAALPGVTLTGEVPDVRPPVWNADVVIAPLLIARGIQNKVLEAMAMAKPIVATPQAIEGTAALPGRHLLAATTPDEWLTALTHLHQHPATAQTLATAARHDAHTRFPWPARLERLWDLLDADPGVTMSEATPLTTHPSPVTSPA